MSKRTSFVLTGLILASMLAGILPALAKMAPKNIWDRRAELKLQTRANLAGTDKYDRTGVPAEPLEPHNLGYNEIGRKNRNGVTVGTTSFDLQSLYRMNRQVEWRADGITGNVELMHFVWTRSNLYDWENLDRGTAYEAWDCEDEQFVFTGSSGGGCDIHPRLGPHINYSGFASLDIDTENKAVIANHHEDNNGLATTVWYDFVPASCFFSPYTERLSDSCMMKCADGDNGYDWHFLWPSHEYQVYMGDTVTHVFAKQWGPERLPDVSTSIIAYFRRGGSDLSGAWECQYSFPVDTVPTVSQIVTSSRNTGKVALVWQAPPGMYPGDPESLTRDNPDPGLGDNERINDVYYMLSPDAGLSWGPKFNVTGYDSTRGGWLGHGEMSALIASDDYLHIIWSARQVRPAAEGLGEFVNFWGSRLFHWDEFNNSITTVKDANWAVPPGAEDMFCTGGRYNEMSIVKPMLSECEGKFYALFVQFQDIYEGLYNDCHSVRFTENDWDGTANGDLFVSVSGISRGLNWDLARNLTGTSTPYCDTVPVGEGCGHEHYPSMPRFGQHISECSYSGVPEIDPSDGAYTGDYYLDVLYVEDKFPGSCIMNRGVWTTNPVKWFRMPCVEPEGGGNLVVTPDRIMPPAWTMPGVPYDTGGTFENIGNAPLDIYGISYTGPGAGTALTGWTTPIYPGQVDSITITVTAPAYQVYRDTIVIASNSAAGSPALIPIELLIVDSLPLPQERDIRTACKRIVFNNAGNLGSAGGEGAGDGGYNLNFFDDCDTTGNTAGDNDHAGVYLYEASPFVSYIDGPDTVLNCYMYKADWFRNDGFKPLMSPSVDSTSLLDYQYGYPGLFCNPDSNIYVEVELYAPTDPDTCDFIVITQKFAVTETINDAFIGDFMDWDVPSDTMSRNGSDFDSGRNLIWCYGAEYGPDDIINDDCVPADQRLGGYAYHGGYRTSNGLLLNRIDEPKAAWTGNNATYVYPQNGFVAEEMYPLMLNKNGFSTWSTTYPESLYADLHTVSCYGQFDLTPFDTLVFCNIYATIDYGDDNEMAAVIDQAGAWLAGRPHIFEYPGFICDCTPGDDNSDGVINILDIMYEISWLYKGGPPPLSPYPLCTGDVNCSCTHNILDVVYKINHLYKGGPAPCTCEDWVAACGLPLRK